MLWIGLGVGGGCGYESREVAGVPGFVENGVEVLEDFIDGHGVHLTSVIVTGFDGAFKIAASDLRGEGVSYDVAGTFFLLDPGEAGHGDPDGSAVDVESDINGVSVAGGDGDDVSSPATVQRLASPAVGCEKVFVHGCF